MLPQLRKDQGQGQRHERKGQQRAPRHGRMGQQVLRSGHMDRQGHVDLLQRGDRPRHGGQRLDVHRKDQLQDVCRDLLEQGPSRTGLRAPRNGHTDQWLRQSERTGQQAQHVEEAPRRGQQGTPRRHPVYGMDL